MQHAQAGLPARVADARFPTHAGLHAPGQQRGPLGRWHAHRAHRESAAASQPGVLGWRAGVQACRCRSSASAYQLSATKGMETINSVHDVTLVRAMCESGSVWDLSAQDTAPP